MTNRERLPNRRAAETFDIEASGLRYTVTIGRYPDDRISEVFIENHKAGSHAGILANDVAVVCSIALQYGASLDVIRKALMRDPRGKASGPLGVALDRIEGAAP
jgi:hypothetical protein